MSRPFSYYSKRPAPFVLVLVLVLVLDSQLTLRAQSLWQEGNSRSMVGDKRAAGVGDILSIVVQESSTATKDNNTQTSKKSSIDASINTFLYSPGASGLLTKGGKLPALQLSGKQDFDGGGKINN